MSNFQEKVSFIWDIADLLRGPYKRSEYQDVVLPFTVLKRFDCILSDTKDEVIKKYEQFKDKFENKDHLLKSATKGLSFYNYSKYDFDSLLKDPEHIEQNLLHYLDCFSENVQNIFENFGIKSQIEKLAKSNLLFKLVRKFNETKIDLHPSVVDNYEMGLIFEELVRKFAEQSNEEAGEHFTPRDVIDLMTVLMFQEVEDEIKGENKIKRIYDPACGTGGMLTSAKDYIHKYVNDSIDIVLYGQEINPKAYAIAKADMLIKGENSDNIKGPFSTLSQDGFADEKFSYLLSNPPYGTKWEADQDEVKKEAEEMGMDGRFGAGLPRINDGQLLFLQHMISKMKINGDTSRIAVITNGSPLFTGDAGSGESDIRKWIIENDMLEAIVALPGQLFYNTGIHTYVWILTNHKPKERLGKIQLVNATAYWEKMRKSLGNKRHKLNEQHIKDISSLYHEFKDKGDSKIFNNEDFGYTKVMVERPLQLNYQASDERLENLYSYSAFTKLAVSKNKNIEKKIKEEQEGKELQKKIIKALKNIGDKLFKNWDEFEKEVIKAVKEFKLTSAFIKNIILSLSEHDDTADYVLDKKGNKQPDSALRDNEKIKLTEDIEEYFKREVLPYYKDAWMDRSKDKVGYEINFTKYFYKYVPPRDLGEIEKDIKDVTSEIDKLLQEEL
jgi:type I restriction enzyme M protein